MNTTVSSWLIKLNPVLKAPQVRLICFPFAGGGTANYAKWTVDLAQDIDLYGINLPGRERFFGQPCLANYGQLIHSLASEIAALSAVPVIFFGHSFGGLTAYLTALELAKKGIMIKQVYISARVPPFCEDTQSISHLPNEEFKQVLIERYQGIPKEILAHPEVMELFLNIIRQDFKLYEQYPQVLASYENKKIDANITTLGFSADNYKEETFTHWQSYTTGIYTHMQLPGGHFEIINNWQPVVSEINQRAGQLIEL